MHPMPMGPGSSTKAQTWALGSCLRYAIATSVSSPVSCCPDLLSALLAWTSDLPCGSVPQVDLRFMLSGPVSSCSWQGPRADTLLHLVQDCQTAQPCLRVVGWCPLARMLPMLGSPAALSCLTSSNSSGKH